MKARVLRPALALALALGTAAAVDAGAAPAKKAAPACNIIVDAKDDATNGVVSLATSENVPAWDVVSADLATDGKRITGVIRVAKLSKTVTQSPTGSAFRLNFEVGGVPLFLQGNTSPLRDTFSFGYVETTSTAFTGAEPNGVFDPIKNEVRISALLAAAESRAKINPGTKLVPVSATAGEWINTAGGNPSLSRAADTAEGGKTYVAGAPSCVAVGK